MGRNRDDFLKPVVETVAKRAAYICSNPDCRTNTIAPSGEEENKFLYMGKVAHITAAAEGGPRFDKRLLSEERSSIRNAIFLCSNCADMIDKNNGADFPVELLKSWKKTHEEWISNNLNKSFSADRIITLDSNPNRDQIIADQYFFAISYFVANFRMNLHCLPLATPIEQDIDVVFRPGRDLLTASPDFDKVTAYLIKYIFTRYDFTKPMVNFDVPRGQPIPTNLSVLLSELNVLDGKCQEILNKYASTGNTEIIHSIEILVNRIDNLTGPFGLAGNQGFSKANLDTLGKLFEWLRDGFRIVEKYRKGKEA